MKVFRDINSNSGHFSIQNGFKAVIKYGIAIMNGHLDWALHELNLDADDWEWFHNRAEALTIPVVYELAEARLHKQLGGVLQQWSRYKASRPDESGDVTCTHSYCQRTEYARTN